jgi:hypothetical protein
MNSGLHSSFVFVKGYHLVPRGSEIGMKVIYILGHWIDQKVDKMN